MFLGQTVRDRKNNIAEEREKREGENSVNSVISEISFSFYLPKL